LKDPLIQYHRRIQRFALRQPLLPSLISKILADIYWGLLGLVGACRDLLGLVGACWEACWLACDNNKIIAYQFL
jgi:hypothetical protein